MRFNTSVSIMVTLLLFAVCGVSRTVAREPDQPKVAVLEFKNKASNQWWSHGGAGSAQDFFISALGNGGKFDVLGREELEDLMRAKNLSISGDVDARTAVKIGKLLGVNYVLAGTLDQYGLVAVTGGGGLSTGKRAFVTAISCRLFETSTGNVVWSDNARRQDDSVKVSVFGVGSGADDARLFDTAMKPVIQKLVTSLLATR